MRFTVQGSERLEATIASQLTALRDDVLKLPWVDCLALGGGYGRGEGGAWVRADGKETPHNDYDLLLVHRIPLRPTDLVTEGRKLKGALRTIEAVHGRATGLHVDIFPVHRWRIPYLPPALTWYELGQGHRVLWGDGQLLRPLVRRTLAQVHPTEWGRLLMNRSAGLVFARWLQRQEPCSIAAGEDPDTFISRQIHKAWLALGDVWLADRAAYHHLVVRRLAHFEARRSEHPSWAAFYRRSVHYKLAPTAPLSARERDEELGWLSELYPPLLRTRAASPARPGVGSYATLRHVPARKWLAMRPWSYPRERLRLAIAAELSGDRRGFERLIGDQRHFTQLWSRYG